LPEPLPSMPSLWGLPRRSGMASRIAARRGKPCRIWQWSKRCWILPNQANELVLSSSFNFAKTGSQQRPNPCHNHADTYKRHHHANDLQRVLRVRNIGFVEAQTYRSAGACVCKVADVAGEAAAGGRNLADFEPFQIGQPLAAGILKTMRNLNPVLIKRTSSGRNP